MALNLKSDRDGMIRFCREPAAVGGELIALFPPNREHRDNRDALTVSDGFVEVSRGYVRRLRSATPADAEEAARFLTIINGRHTYTQEVIDYLNSNNSAHPRPSGL